jgi:putative oxidoreductase
MKNVTLSGGMPRRNGVGRFVENNNKTIVQIISGLLILLFLYTGANKFFSFQHFIKQMNNQVFPNSWAPYIVWTIPSLEIAIAFALMFDKTKKAALWGSLILMSLFTIYTALVLFNVFDRVPCSCGGVIEHLTWTQHLFFNSFFVTISIVGILLWKKQNKTLEHQTYHEPIFT